MFSPVHLKEKFSAQNFNNISTDAYINHSVIVSRGTNKNPAGTLHLDALLDQHPFVALRHAMTDHPSRCAAGSRASGGILAVVELHAGMQPGRRINRLACDAIEEFSAGLTEIFAGLLLVDG